MMSLAAEARLALENLKVWARLHDADEDVYRSLGRIEQAVKELEAQEQAAHDDAMAEYEGLESGEAT